MRENWLYISNKSMVAIKASLFVAFLIGLVVYSVSVLVPVHASGEVECVKLCPDYCSDKGYAYNACRSGGCEAGETDLGKIGCPTCQNCCCWNVPEEDCYDGIDNDGDGLTDCEDPDCDGEYCGNCLDNDCLIDSNPFTFDNLLSGTKTCIDGSCSSDTCEYEHFCADDDLYDSITVSCHATCDEDEDCESYCEGDVLYYGGVCDIDEDCTCVYDIEDCDESDGCYVYEDGCEERDYFCDPAGCDYTYSNRNTDSYEEWVYYCDNNELRKHRKLHDFYCDSGICEDHPDWVDDQLVQDCYYLNYYCVGDDVWYEEGFCDPSGPVCDYDSHFDESCDNDYEFCADDERWEHDEYCIDGYCDYDENLIEDCSDNNYDECQDVYYKHHYTESCSESDGETQCLPASSLVDCRDEYWCDGQEYCVENIGVHCEDGTPVDCDDADECTYDNCIEDGYNTGHCENPHKDEQPPETTKWYEGPYKFGSGPDEWITSETEVWMSAEDQGPQGLPQCAVGVDKILYKDVYLPDEEDWHYCYVDCGEWTPNDYEDEGWVEYLEPFHKEPESCHIIEYYSEDLLGNKEEIDWQCVFVDNTPPVITKTVGDPKAECEGIECEDWDYKITISTPITLDCEDLGDHPVDDVEMYYRIFWDGELVKDWTQYEGETIYFPKTCLHKLEVYCIDALDNIAWDNETFKVVDKEFTITLNKKWNLISVPILLLDDDVEDVLEDVEENVEIVWAYDAEADEWYVYTPDGEENDNLEEMFPGWGYWIKMSQGDTLLLGGESWGMPPSPPSPQRNLVEGWNLIGYYGTEGLENYNGPYGNGDYAACTLNSLLDLTNIPQWTKILTYWEPYNPNQWVDTSSMCDALDPGAGYWIFMKSDQLYGPGECTEELCD